MDTSATDAPHRLRKFRTRCGSPAPEEGPPHRRWYFLPECGGFFPAQLGRSAPVAGVSAPSGIPRVGRRPWRGAPAAGASACGSTATCAGVHPRARISRAGCGTLAPVAGHPRSSAPPRPRSPIKSRSARGSLALCCPGIVRSQTCDAWIWHPDLEDLDAGSSMMKKGCGGFQPGLHSSSKESPPD